MELATSAHSITAFALAFAVAAAWPRLRGVMIAYALVIAFTRLVLLAHHPSDVVAGAAIGIIGAMCVRYWFAVRGLGFAVRVFEQGGDEVRVSLRVLELEEQEVDPRGGPREQTEVDTPVKDRGPEG